MAQNISKANWKTKFWRTNGGNFLVTFRKAWRAIKKDGHNLWWHVKCAQHATPNPKLEEMGFLFRDPRWWRLKRLKNKSQEGYSTGNFPVMFSSSKAYWVIERGENFRVKVMGKVNDVKVIYQMYHPWNNWSHFDVDRSSYFEDMTIWWLPLKIET